jgi:NDP-sugar pyrophosphorylase family protein
LLGLQGADAGELVLLGFPDTIWEPVDGFTRLLRQLAPGVDVVLGVFESEEPERSDVVTLAGGRVASVEVKPVTPAGSLVWGCAAATAGALAALEGHGEPGHLFAELAGRGRVRAVRLRGAMIDVGTPAALARARAQLG